MKKVCCRCLYKEEEPDSFSDNIYKDITLEMQWKEYEDTKQLMKDCTRRMKLDPQSEYNALRAYYKTRLELKLRFIKYQLACTLAQSEETKEKNFGSTKQAFF
jgi:hypothetical protein